MIISINYNLGNNSLSKYFDTYKEAISFIKKFQEVNNSDFLHFEFYVYTGKEEERVRGIKDEQEMIKK